MKRRRTDSSGYLAYSFTDLMTSLMVIFILLLLAFIDRQAELSASKTDALLALLRRELPAYGFRRELITLDPKDRLTILVITPNELMNFKTNEYALGAEGYQFLARGVPHFAALLCGVEYRDSIDSIVVEGHSDSEPYRGASAEESENRNLKLSQDRSMEVVKTMLTDLAAEPGSRACFLEMLSAAGRGERDLEDSADHSRRVVFKIRVKAAV
jgi:flagellar motor protein MotB